MPVAATQQPDRTELVVWIDTAFNGSLVIPRKQILLLELVKESSAEAILADGETVAIDHANRLSILDTRLTTVVLGKTKYLRQDSNL